MIKQLLVLGLVSCAVGSGCGDDGGGGMPLDANSPDASNPDAAADASTGVFEVDGLVGTGAPATGTVIVAWIVSSGSPDYVYKFGEGTSTGAQFMLALNATPPTAAINSYGVGVGMVVLMPAGTTFPDGIIVDDAVLEDAGYTARHSIIYKEPTADESLLPWIAPFPTGYSCGQCVPASGAGRDTYAPTACTSLEIVIPPTSTEDCNWT